VALLIAEDSLDDLIHELYEHLLRSGQSTIPTKGAATELTGVTLELLNPRARLSRTAIRGRLFSGLGELCWYLSGSDSVRAISYYISHYNDVKAVNNHVPGAYGPRLLDFDRVNQLEKIVEMLRRNRWTRRAVIQLFDHQDLASNLPEVPCTCTLQFLSRNNRLELIVYMRSNDAYLGLPHDVFAFTMMQELIARRVGAELGSYVHVAGSMHLYDDRIGEARAFLSEGWQSPIPMPAMPSGDPSTGIEWLLTVEQQLREGDDPHRVELHGPEPYWSDLACLLAIFALTKQKRIGEIQALKGTLSSPVYDLYVADRLA
jgi:thymidylate synthase